jgi:NitT/TauT family transport system ATP-binding protein
MTRERMNMEIHNIWRRTGITVIFVTHSILEAVFLSTRVIVSKAVSERRRRPGQAELYRTRSGGHEEPGNPASPRESGL